MKFVSCVKWIKRGVSKSVLDKITLDQDELNDLLNARTNSEKSEEKHDKNEEDEDDEYDFANYDEEDGAESLKIGNVAVISNEGEDKTILDDEPDSDDEDEVITESDNMIVVGCSMKDCDVLNIYVYNEESDDLYVHHDIILPSCPLSLEWLDYFSQNESGNLIAVGEMSPEIEIWDLDIFNPIEPVCKLGYKASKEKYAHRNVGHKEAVLSLSWNTNFPHILASGSADKTIHLWDLDNKKPSTILTSFDNSVESIEWHSLEGQILLAGSSDRSIKIFDCHYQNSYKEWTVDNEVLNVKWNVWNPFCAVAGTSDGKLYGIDSRNSDILWSTESFDSDITAIEMVECNRGMLVAAYQDGLVRVWDINKASPENIASLPGTVGQIYSLSVNSDAPHIAGVGGMKKNGTFSLLNFNKITEVTERWGT